MAEERERLEAEEKDDAEGHVRKRPTVDTSGTGDDVEGHVRKRPTVDMSGADDDDVEGHVRKRPT